MFNRYSPRQSRNPPLIPLAPLEQVLVTEAPASFPHTLADIFNSLDSDEPAAAVRSTRRQVKETRQVRRPSTSSASVSSCGDPGCTGSGRTLSKDRRATGFEFRPGYQTGLRPRLVPGASGETRHTGELRKTDVRSYGTLDQLLSLEAKPPTPPKPLAGSAPAAPQDLGQGILPLLAEGTVATLATLAKPSTAPPGFRRPPSEAVVKARKPSHLGRAGNMQLGSHAADEIEQEGTKEEKADSSSASSQGAQGEGDPEAKAILQELEQEGVSQEWSLVLGVVPTEKRLHEAHHALGDDMQLQFVNKEEKPSSSLPKEENIAPFVRPISPLRPGVYCGHDDKDAVKARDGVRPPTGLPQGATWGHGVTGMWSSLSPPVRPATAGFQEAVRAPPQAQKHGGHRASDLAAGMSVWQHIASKIEDESRTEDSKAYEAWRHRVVECSRNMQLEIARFKFHH